MVGPETGPSWTEDDSAAADTPTAPPSVRAIENHETFHPAEVSVVQIPLDEITLERLSAELTADMPDISVQELIERSITNAQIDSALKHIKLHASDAYMLFWEGSTREPRGVEIGMRTIGGTKNGFVRNVQGAYIGVYQRLLDNESLQGDDGPLTNAMLIFV